MDEDEYATQASHPHTMTSTHYYGDVVRVLLVISAIFIFLLEFTIHDLPLSTGAVITLIVIMLIAAGITNPAQIWIHWANLIIVVGNLITFGTLALERFQLETSAPTHALLYATITLLFMVNLYFATRTLRGLLIHKKAFSR